jgi:hypothetical protein
VFPLYNVEDAKIVPLVDGLTPPAFVEKGALLPPEPIPPQFGPTVPAHVACPALPPPNIVAPKPVVDINILGNNRYRIGGNAIGNWFATTIPTDIYYDIGNAGIGTSTPSTKLHINDNLTETTSINIENSINKIITSSPTAPVTGTTGNYTYIVLTYTTETGGTGTRQTLYTITSPSGGLVCDILMVGGGGAGGKDIGSGGGGGAVLYGTNITVPVGNYNLYVGNGATAADLTGVSSIVPC